MIAADRPLQTLGAAIRDERRAARLTQAQLAELAGCSDRTLRDIERGAGSPSIGTVVAVLDALGLGLEVTV